MRIKDIMESPYLNNDELPFKTLSRVSNEALKRTYTLFSEISIADESLILNIYTSNISGFIAGFLTENGDLDIVVNMSCRDKAYPVKPNNLSNYEQVSMVNVSKDFAERGFTKLVYNSIAKKINIVSDHEQYLGAKGLWKSLARDSDVNIYIFDGRIKDYVRDDNGNIMKYNGKNINDSDIWGSTEKYRLILLIATTEELV